MLGVEDLVFKGIAYRQELNAIARRTASAEGLKGDAFNQRMADIVMNPDAATMELASKHADYQTFTKELGETGRYFQKLTNSHWALKIVVPFIRTPTNILKYAGERTPLGVFSAEVRNNLSGRNGVIARDTQIARIGLGTAIGTATLGLAVEGLITGGGPSDPKEKAALKMTGWQPYSIKIGDTYYSYQWADPFSTIMGVSADMVDIAKSKQGEDADDSRLAAMLFAAISKNIMSKLSLRGASDLIQALTDSDRYGDKYIQNLAGTVVPSFMAQAARTLDPVQREARTTIDAIKSRIPGLREELLPRRDVWGEPLISQGSAGPDALSPIYQTRLSKDPVNIKLQELNVFPAKLSRKIRGVELTDQQYDEYQKLSGKMTKMRLDAVVNQAGFSTLPPTTQTDAIRRITASTRDMARSIMMMKNPDIVKQANDNKRREIEGIKH